MARKLGNQLLADLKGKDHSARQKAVAKLNKAFRGKVLVDEVYRDDIIEELSKISLLSFTQRFSNTRYSAIAAISNAAKKRRTLPDSVMNTLFFEELSGPKSPKQALLALKVFSVLDYNEQEKAAMLLKKSLLSDDITRISMATGIIHGKIFRNDRPFVFPLDPTEIPEMDIIRFKMGFNPSQLSWLKDLLVPLGHVRLNTQLPEHVRIGAERVIKILSTVTELHVTAVEALALKPRDSVEASTKA